MCGYTCNHASMFAHVQYTIYFLSGSTHPLLKEITQEVLLVRRRDTPPLPHLKRRSRSRDKHRTRYDRVFV